MKILHVYKDFDPPIRGGIERHVALMCRYQRQWADVEGLICSRTWRTRRIVRDGTRLTEVGEWGRFQSAPLSPMFPFYLKIRRADVVVIHVPNPTAEVSWLTMRPSGRLVVRYHSDVIRQASAMKVYGPFLRRFLSRADLVIPTSEPYVLTSPMLRQIDPGKIRVVPLGIIPEEFQQPNAARVQQLRAQYGGKSGRYVLFSGIHRYYKGLEYLIQAAANIDAPVVVAGDGPEHERIRQLARDLQVSVHFPGPLSHDDLVDHLHGCDVFLFPSVERSEAFGISMLEAQVCCKPVVATRLGTGVEYVNLDGQTGLNVPPRDPVAFARAVNGLLADEAARARMGAFARDRVMREFTAESTARREFMLYQEILG
jgi:rhamnosyl/mannosyltransferase